MSSGFNKKYFIKNLSILDSKINTYKYKKLNILYLNIDKQDYLSDSLLIGLRDIASVSITEYPKNKFIYKSKNHDNQLMYGRGFTLYNQLDDNKSHLDNLPLNYDEFDFVIFSSIANQIELYLDLNKIINRNKLIIIDGDDLPAFIPFFGKFWRNIKYWNFPILHSKHMYFKRELTLDTIFYRYYKVIPRFLLSKVKLGKKIFPISFSIPLEKIVSREVKKLKNFPNHIVDLEIAEKVMNSNIGYVFETEEDYYNDLQSSRYGITMKKAGWDCLRHYEIAANASVICFRDLDRKPLVCAPHGLVPGKNCLSYSCYEDLISQIGKIGDHEYYELQSESLKWIKSKSTISLASYFLNEISRVLE